MISDDEIRIRQRLKDDFEHYAAKCLKIRSNDGSIVPFQLNRAQAHIHQKVEEQRALTGKVRAVILKGRQEGCSTYIEGRFYWRVTHSRGYQAFILTHALDATQNLYKMVKRYHDNCPLLLRPSTATSNAKELIFDKLDSGYKLGTAENKSVGRSSTIQLLHGSEAAFWANAHDHAKGIMQAVPNAVGTEVFIESTANGVGGYFHEQWQLAEAGISDFIAIFVPWFWMQNYALEVKEPLSLTAYESEIKSIYKLTDAQLLWRRGKIVELSSGGIDGSKAFQQEYPMCAAEAFIATGEDTFIQPEVIMSARKCETEAVGALLIGVDPARFGDDRTSIVRRRGRVAYKIENYLKKNTMEIAGIVHKIIIDEQPDKVFVDVVGLGAGVYDRLVELGHRDVVVAANASLTALNSQKYSNRRAEMWGLMKEWLIEQPAQIPDDDVLHADLCGPKYTFDSNGRLVIEKKELMKKRGIRSPDSADALSLTFFYPVSSFAHERKKDKIAERFMSKYKKINQLKDSRYGQ